MKNKEFKNKESRSLAGFTLVELVVTIAIIAVLSGMIMFTVNQYVSKGKDSNVAGNLAILVPSGEAFYNANGNSYEDFCNPSLNSVMKNLIAQMPKNINGYCYYDNPDSGQWGTSGKTSTTGNPAGICCNVDSVAGQYWVAWAREFQNASKVYCVDNRGGRVRELDYAVAKFTSTLNKCPDE